MIMSQKIRLHLLGIPHTITKMEYSHCAFTGKVLRFSPMMRSVGYEVYHYGTETSTSGADVDIQIFTLKEFYELRNKSYKQLHPSLTDEEVYTKLNDPTQQVGDLANWNTELYSHFNARLRPELMKHYRSSTTDIVCIPFGPSYVSAVEGLNFVCVETGIGYNNAFLNYRIYESYAIMHYDAARCNIQSSNYWFVCPNYYNIQEWPFQPNYKKLTIGYFGRITHIKGLAIVVEVARRFPHVEFHICGQGAPAEFLSEPNIIYHAPLHGKDRWDYVSQFTALIAPSLYLEPFCGVSVEAQLCGVPVISPDNGAFVENIEQFKTGVRCHTLSDYCYGIQMALDDKFDRKYIHERAVRLFDMYNVAKQYDYIFRSINDVHNGTNGWYSPNKNLEVIDITL